MSYLERITAFLLPALPRRLRFVGALAVVIFAALGNAHAEEQRYASWNTFLGMRDIIELSNTADGPQQITLSILAASGNTVFSQAILLQGVEQRDFILNDIAQLPANAYGTVIVSAPSDVISRVVFYLPERGNSGFQFAFVEPLREPLSGNSSVSFNTIQPSADPADRNLLVANWLTIINLSTNEVGEFYVDRFDGNGNFIQRTQIDIPANGRIDLPSGHETGEEIVGLNRISPLNSALPYLAQLVRYGSGRASEAQAFRFAVPLLAAAGGAQEQWVGISRGAEAVNWLEVVNTSASAMQVRLDLYSNQGQLLSGAGGVQFALPANAQYHFYASGLLPPGGSGIAKIQTSSSGAAFIRSMFYHLNRAGAPQAVYSFLARAADADSKVASWNLFLGARNWLRIFNVGDTPVTVTENIFLNNFSNPRSFVLGAHSGIDLGLHETNRYGTALNNFGIVSVTGNQLITELLRLRPASDGSIDFVFPIPFTSGNVAARPEKTIYQPRPGTSWQWQLTGTIDQSVQVEMYDIDLENTPKASIDSLKSAGRKVICYFSAGTWEQFRADAAAIPVAAIGKALDDFPDEKWLDVRRIDLLAPVMRARLDAAVAKGCDGVEPDNVDGYTNDSGFPLTGSQQLAYNRWIAEEAHARNLSVGLKNDLDQVAELVDSFDWALNEQCFQYGECAVYSEFIVRNKAVFGVEYQGSASSFCPQANALNLDWLKKNLDLDAARQSCR